MRIALIILFTLLYVGNSHICTFFYPYDINDPSTHYLYVKWWQMRDVLYEIMFLLLLPIPIYKRSKIADALLVVLVVVVFFSMSDKAQGVSTYHHHDIFVIMASLIIGYELFKYYARKKKK